LLTRVADVIGAHPKRVLLIAFLLALAAGALGGGVAAKLAPWGDDDPAVEDVRATAAYERASGEQPDPGVIAVVRTKAGVRAPEGRRRVEAIAGTLLGEPAIKRVVTYFDTRERTMLSRDGRSTYVLGFFRTMPDDRTLEVADRISDRLGSEPGVTLGGWSLTQKQLNATVESDLRTAELIAFPILFLLSLLFFRGLVAAALPPLIAGVAVIGTLAVLQAVNQVVDVSIFALNLATGLGLGLAIDYGLFMVSRYREELAARDDPRDALRATMATAGRTVLFSSITIAAAMASLLIFPQRFLYSMGIGGVAVTVIAGITALVVLPALLAVLGHRINALAPKRLQAAAERDARPLDEGGWYRLSRFVMRRPARVAIAGAVILIALGIPFLGVKFNSVDAEVLPQGTSARQAHDLLQRDFRPGLSDPVQVVANGSPDSPAVTSLAARAANVPRVTAVSEPRAIGAGKSLVDVYTTVPALSDSAVTLVRDVRALREGEEFLVRGRAAHAMDVRSSLRDHLPLALAIVVVSSLVVLFLFTGSLVLPVKAVIMNLLTLSATFGLLVVIFQDGRLESVLGYTSPGSLEQTQPILIFAVVFGLSTDYGVFLLSRIKEARDRGANDAEAVARGLERTGRIVTAAAVLFCVAIGALAMSSIIFIKELGIGTAFAVLIDATIVRALLVPALMGLLGRWNWWAPAPLRRLYERIGLSEETSSAARLAGARAG
jgi:uncharacterized membrane protein YdfJ with MMPL/SSD domain